MDNSWLSFFFQHGFAVLISLPFFSVLALLGVLLVLRRASLFGMALAQAAQVSFVLGVGWHFAGHEDAFSFINRAGANNLAGDLYHLDLYVFPLTFLFLLPFLLLARRPLRSVESGLTLSLILFINLLPLANRLVGGTERSLLAVYFSEILYTPRDMFWHYLPYMLAVAMVFLFFRRAFVIAGYDPTQAGLIGIKPSRANLLFYVLAGIAISAAVRVVGSYLTMAALVAPPMAALLLGQTLTMVFLYSAILAILAALGGFAVAFALPDYPSEPLVMVMFAVQTALIWLVTKFWRYRNLRNSVDTAGKTQLSETNETLGRPG